MNDGPETSLVSKGNWLLGAMHPREPGTSDITNLQGLAEKGPEGV